MINFVVIPVVFIGYLLTIASSIPDEIKVGFCVAALCAGMPFAPILAKLGKADVGISTTLLVILTFGTIIALPIGLPLAVDAVDVQLTVSAWDVAWPLLLFLLLPLVLGCGFRVWWPDLTPPLTQWTVRVAILCLLFNVNFTLVAYWDLFVQEWGTEELHRGHRRPIHRPRVRLPARLRSSGQGPGRQARGRDDHGSTQHRPDAADDDLPLCRRSIGHGVDHHPQHHRHHGRPAVRPGVEAGCFADLPGERELTLISLDTKTRVTPKPCLLDRSLANRGAVKVLTRVAHGQGNRTREATGLHDLLTDLEAGATLPPPGAFDGRILNPRW